MSSDQLTVVLFSGLMIVVVGWRTWATARKQGSVRGQTSMLWSFYALYAMGVVVFGGSALEFFLLARPRRLGCAVTGIALYIVAQLIRAAAVRALGRYWSLHIEIRQQQSLIREGPYRYVRHPAYAAFVLEHIAVPLAGRGRISEVVGGTVRGLSTGGWHAGAATGSAPARSSAELG